MVASETFEEKVERACRELDIPGAVFVAGSQDGSFRYAKAFGRRSLRDLARPDPMPVDAVMWYASCTKLLTTVSVMQCVEKGLLTLDEDVTRLLPELKGIKILKGFEEGPEEKPILVDSKKPITLRHLLTHTSGLGYDVFNPTLMRYRKMNGFTPNLGVSGSPIEACTFPLLFEPGESWEYGVGLDWAGWMVERANNGMSLEEYMSKNIWAPLGVSNFSFFPTSNPDISNKLVDMSEREGGITMYGTTANPENRVVHSKNTIWNLRTNGCSGGAGGFGSPIDYQKLLHSILVADQKILTKASIDELFTPHLNAASRRVFMRKLKIPEMNRVYGGYPPGTKVDYGLGGAVVMEDLAGRKKGTMAWGGLPNLTWFIDRVGGMSGIVGSQIVPPGDPKMVGLYFAWEKEMYERAGNLLSKL